ncbi:heparinase II/III-like protein [Pseudoduganella lurida]|uniref:Heparinase II/III-like protein n=1 Tax=Pseudoduganella lurida TaxID=1036180 RepID=A0A562QY17_9BURK|nr:DUF4962 domain-containing protein [Pseudoduganella lurida]TWI61204.1 heparinase II/III-like protein [Pseudoduganella lurida]
MNQHITRRRFLGAAALALPALSTGAALAQDAREALGPKEGKPGRGPHPLQALMQQHPAALRTELRGVHPRVFTTAAGLAEMRQRATGSHRAAWQKALAGLVAMREEPAPAPAQKRRAQNTVGIGIVGAALAYRIEGDQRYLDAAKRYMEAAVSYPVWGYTFSKPDVDLAAGHLLYGLGTGYDLLFDVLTEEERKRYRDKLQRQGRLLAAHFAPRPGKTFSYSQNHCFIPIAGLAIAAYAVWDEVPEAAGWAAQARAIFGRVLDVASPDGYFYEGVEYWIFSMPWIIHALDAFAHAAGDDLYDHPALRNAHLYMAHSLTPNGQDIFDFGDAFEGPLTRSRHGDEAARTHPDGKLHSNYNLLYRLAARHRNRDAQGVADWMASLGHVCAEDFWTLAWYDTKLPATPIAALPPHHHFDDLGTVYWRSDWTDQATAFAFRAGPPEGHHAATLLDKLPDWHLSMGHSHPDAGSFILYGGGTYLTGPMGYAGVPRSNLSNTLLIDGQGQANEGHGHDAFDSYPYARLDTIRLTTVKLTASGAEIVADLAGAYRPELGVEKLERTFQFAGDTWTTTDRLRARKPVVLTAQVHGDTTIAQSDRRRYTVAGKPATLAVDVAAAAKAIVEPGIVTAAGPPGNVDKGPRQERGTVLRISLPAAREATLVTTMKVARA